MAKKYDCAFVDNEMPYGRVPQGHPVIVDYFYHEEIRGTENTGKEIANFQFIGPIRNKQQQLYKRKNPPRIPSPNRKAPGGIRFRLRLRSVGRSFYIGKSSVRIKGISGWSAQGYSY